MGGRDAMKWLASGVAIAVVALSIAAEHAAAQSVAITLIRRECSTCHGQTGISVAPTFPNLAGQQAPYLEAQLKAFRDRSRADPHAQAFMWGMAAQLADGTIGEIAAYYAAQRPAPARPVSAADMSAGRRIYEEGIESQLVPACQSCHLKDAEGAALVPRLAGQQRRYLEKQMTFYGNGRRDNPIM